MRRHRTREDYRRIEAALAADPRVSGWYCRSPDGAGLRWSVWGPELNLYFTTREVEVFLGLVGPGAGL